MTNLSRNVVALGLSTFAALLAVGGRAAAGPVVIGSQDGTVRAEIDPSHGEAVVVDTEAGPAAGSYSRTATAQVAITDFTADATSSVEVTAGDNGFTFAGALEYAAQDTRPDDPDSGIPSVKLDAAFHVTFTIDEPRDYDFRRTFTRGDNYAFNSFEQLQTLDGVDVDFLDIDANGGGTLQPGTYELTVAESAQGLIGPGAGLNATYEVALELKPVPLPPAVWSGLIVFAAAGVNRLRKGRAG